MVSVLTFYSDDPSLNPAKAYSFSVKFLFEKKENKQKAAGVGLFLKVESSVKVNKEPLKCIINEEFFKNMGRIWPLFCLFSFFYSIQ